MRSETCSRCGEELRYGKRGNLTGWLHRLDVDHAPILGTIRTVEMLAEDERQRQLPRTRMVTRSKGKGDKRVTWEEEETYTLADLELATYRKQKKFREAEERELEFDEDEDRETTDDIEVEEYPEPEMRRTPVTADEFPPRSGIRQICNLVAKTDGWEIVRFTKARGPYIGAAGGVLSTSDSVVLGARGPVQVDGTRRVAVASWRDGSFDSAYTGVLEGGQITTTGVNSAGLKAWIKG